MFNSQTPMFKRIGEKNMANRSTYRWLLLLVLISFAAPVRAQVGVLGITDKSYGAYANQATFNVTNEAGFSYDARSRPSRPSWGCWPLPS